MKKILLIAAAALTLAACDKNDDNPAPSSVAAKISATIGESTVSRASGTEWAPGDAIGITTSFQSKTGPFINMQYTTTAGDGAFGGTPIYIYNPMSLTAYYPFAGTEGKAAGTIEANTGAGNQTSANQPKIDFLFASKNNITTDSPAITLDFSHRMSKLTFIFKDGTGADVSKITSYKIDGLVLDGTFDTATGICAAKDVAATPLAIEVADVQTGEPVPSLILFPQTLKQEVKLTITDSDKQVYACTLTFADNPIAAGNNYQFKITINKTGLTVEQSGITDWNNIEPTENNADAIDPE